MRRSGRRRSDHSPKYVIEINVYCGRVPRQHRIRDHGGETTAMARPVRAILAVLVLLAGAVPARAQLLDPDDQPGPLVREALASPYGRALLTELGKRLRESADPACLAALCIGKR
jgi:hypothetical protein